LNFLKQVGKYVEEVQGTMVIISQLHIFKDRDLSEKIYKNPKGKLCYINIS